MATSALSAPKTTKQTREFLQTADEIEVSLVLAHLCALATLLLGLCRVPIKARPNCETMQKN